MGTSKFDAGGNPEKQHTIQRGRGEEILLHVMENSATLKNHLAWMQISYPDRWCWSSVHYPFGDWACLDLSALLTLLYLFVICALLVLDLWCTDWVSGDLSCIHWMELKHTDSVSLVQNTGEPLINGHSRKWDVGHLPSHLVGVGVLWIFFKILLFLCENGIMLRQS